MVNKQKILIVDDDANIAELISLYLTKECFDTMIVEDGESALRAVDTFAPNLILLDLMLPGMDGWQVLREIRKTSNVPIIMLTAKTMEDDMLNGLDLGADDYITKPFSLKNLYARVRAVLRRASDDLEPLAEKIFWNEGDLAVDYDRKEVYKKGQAIAVTPIEWKILMALTKYPQKVFTRENLIELVFDLDFSGYDRVIDTHVKNLRKKIEDDPKNPVYICTVHGMGYKFGGRV